MIEVELLKGIPEGELKHWAKINGYDESWFNTIYTEWLIANPDAERTPVEPTIE